MLLIVLESKKDECDFSDMSELYESIYNKARGSASGYKEGSLTFQDTRFYFDGEDTDTMIIGIILTSLNDGVVCQLPEPDDEKAKEKIGKLLGKDIEEDLHTYVQFISNDNY